MSMQTSRIILKRIGLASAGTLLAVSQPALAADPVAIVPEPGLLGLFAAAIAAGFLAYRNKRK